MQYKTVSAPTCACPVLSSPRDSLVRSACIVERLALALADYLRREIRAIRNVWKRENEQEPMAKAQWVQNQGMGLVREFYHQTLTGRGEISTVVIPVSLKGESCRAGGVAV
ncbi:hypothetical protein HUJ04_008694 [Dendroctonus ponderosae]|nr:hypothetical protein HUJ04_008694 [Dendroctonus ponderosae]KAH1008616.1 hypothetical protein HUJ05_009154 [Dendroctonus ponderosae]